LIEVNLLPGGGKRAKKGGGGPGFKLKLPQIGGLPTDKWVLSAGAIAVVALGLIAYLFLNTRSAREEEQVLLDEQVQDSARFADLIARTQLLTARRDSIAQRVGIIQQIDQNRFVWAHILDEVSRALPEYTWLTELSQVSNDPISVRLTGQAGNNFALTVFMEALETSPFLQNVTLIQSNQEFAGQGTSAQQVVQGFILEVAYVPPPAEFLQTVPLFEGAGETQTQTPDTTAAPAPGAPRGED
jgi:type IV pilus assembly protein PilN